MKKINGQRTRTCIILLSLLLLAATFLVRLPFLVVSGQNAENVLTFSILFNKSFSYNYIHSVQKTPATENFIIDNNRIVLTSTVYKSLGVGLPFSPDEGRLANKNGNFVITGLNRSFEEISFRAMPVASQALILNGKKYRLNDYFPPGALIVVKPEKLTLIQRITGLKLGNHR